MTDRQDIWSAMMNWLHDPENNMATAWGLTLFFGAVSLLVWVIFPAFFAFSLMVSLYLSLSAWRWYYSEWIENCLYDQPREAIGSRAVVVNLRVATAGAGAAVLIVLLFGITLNRQVTSGTVLLFCGLSIVAIPLSLVIPKVKAVLIGFLKAVFDIPFNIAVVWMAITTEEDLLDSRYKTMNANAKALFSMISGHPSNTTLLHETDAILRQLPTRR